MKVFVLGSLNKTGGASSEMLGAVQLWRKFGLDVGVIPTWEFPVEKKYTEPLTSIGCTLYSSTPRDLGRIEGFAGSTVVCFCNEAALRARQSLKQLGCRVVFAPLMCFLQGAVRSAAEQKLINDWVFQSQYQMSILVPQLKVMGYDSGHFHLCRGYIDWPSIKFNPRPHASNEPFVIGRAARPRASKWHKDWWKMYEMVSNREAILLGPDEETIRQIGRPPSWATVHKAGTYPVDKFYQQLHATVTCNDSDKENAPRITLESFAYGVAVCAENRFGFKEQIVHGQTGMLGEKPCDIGMHAKLLSVNEDFRMEIVKSSRKNLEQYLCHPEVIWEAWKKVLGVPDEYSWTVPTGEQVKKDLEKSLHGWVKINNPIGSGPGEFGVAISDFVPVSEPVPLPPLEESTNV